MHLFFNCFLVVVKSFSSRDKMSEFIPFAMKKRARCGACSNRIFFSQRFGEIKAQERPHSGDTRTYSLGVYKQNDCANPFEALNNVISASGNLQEVGDLVSSTKAQSSHRLGFMNDAPSPTPPPPKNLERPTISKNSPKKLCLLCCTP